MDTNRYFMNTLKISSEQLSQQQRRLDFVVLALIFGVGLALRLAYIAVTPGDPTQSNQDPHYYALIAQNLNAGRGYAELSARAYRPPAFPFLLSLIYAVFGAKVGAAQVVVAVFGALHPVLLALWARILSTRRVGYLAGGLAAIHPQFLRYPQMLYSEAFYFFILALATLLLLRALRSGSTAQLVLAGLSFGAAALTREITLVMPLLVGLWFWLNRPSAARNAAHREHNEPRPVLWQGTRSARAWWVFSLSMALAVVPWTARNYRIFHALVPISTNAGINFYMGNNAKSTATPDFSDPDFWKLAPGVSWREGAGELEAHQKGFREGLHYVAAHPAQSLGRYARKAVIFWTPPLGGFGGLPRSAALIRGVWLVFTLLTWGLALYGLWVTRRAWRLLALPILVVVTFSLPYVASYVDTRYRLPLEGFLLFYTALGLEAMLQRRSGVKTIQLSNQNLQPQPDL